MKERILATLIDLEQRHNLRILYACEAGSRAWGIDSPDSDYDVRFIYVKPLEHYVQLFQPKEDTTSHIEGLLDVHGWDLPKALHLMMPPNCSLVEWLHSPVVYLSGDEVEKIKSALLLRRKAMIQHYRGLAKSTWQRFLSGESTVNLKKYFYAVRPLLCARWLDKKRERPPVEFEKLLPLAPEGIRADLEDLLQRKRAGSEMEMQPTLPEIHRWIETELEDVWARLRRMPEDPPADTDRLGELYHEMIGFKP